MATPYPPAYPAYAPAPAPPPRKSRASVVVIVLLVLALLGVGVALFLQYQKTTSTAANRDKMVAALADTNKVLADTQATLKTTEGDLETTKASLSTANSTISSQRARLGDCGAVVKVSRHQWKALDYALKAMDDDTLSELSASIGYLTQGTAEMETINTIVENRGFEYIDDLWVACSNGNGSNV